MRSGLTMDEVAKRGGWSGRSIGADEQGVIVEIDGLVIGSYRPE